MYQQQPQQQPPPPQGPPMGYASPPPGQPMPMPPGQPGMVVTGQPQPAQVVVIGGCPKCGVGRMDDNFTCLGICCAILFFPLGIICCLAMREKRCTSCGASP